MSVNHSGVGVEVSQLAAPDVRHRFSTREGGVSAGPFASLNLGGQVGDDPAAVAENRARFALSLGLAGPEHLVEARQVHGPRVVRADADRAAALADVEADGLWTDEPGLAVGIRTADCAPILLRAERVGGGTGAVAAIHAGWRGAAAGVVKAAVAALEAAGHPPSRMWAAVGPCIGIDAFEVGPEVVEALTRALGAPPKSRPGPRGRPHVALADTVARLLIGAGLPKPQVFQVDACTASDPKRFFSHRRDAGRTGRHLSAIVIHR